MGTDLRLTPQTVEVLRALLAEPAKAHYGRELGKAAGLKSGTIHPILARLEGAGLVESFWEEPAAHEDQGRPRRRYYRFTDGGAEAARLELARSRTSTGHTGATSIPRLQPGF